MSEFKIVDLHVSVEGKEIVKGLNLTMKRGEVHALMGPNGSGKSTLAQALMGHPNYEITSGDIILDGEPIARLGPDERAKKGLFLAFQYPMSIPGVSLANLLRASVSAVRLQGDAADKYRDPRNPDQQPMIPMREFRKEFNEMMDQLGIERGFARRYVNDGFSGGEKKRAEILQLGLLKPKYAVMDETDSGLDIDGVRTVAEGVSSLGGADMGILVITHYQRILNYITPDHVHILMDGRIVESGGKEVALHLEEKGYDWVREKHGPANGSDSDLKAVAAAAEE